MPTKPLAAAIYEEQLVSPAEGFPLWEPGPGSNQPPVEIADVGYLSSGGWIRLFNTSKPLGDPSNGLGVPVGYEPLAVGSVQERAALPAKVPIFSETVEKRGLEAALVGAPGAPLQAGGGFSFKCSKERGAVLVLGDDAERRDALRTQDFASLIVEQSASWLNFANDIHRRGLTLDDLVLVTGCDKTSSWACAAFSRESTEASISFGAGQPGIMESNISLSWIWSSCSSVAMRSGPPRSSIRNIQHHTDSASSSIGNLTSDGGASIVTDMQTNVSPPLPLRPPIRDQCVFLRGYKICDRKTWKVRRLLRRKKPYDGFEYMPRKRRDDTEDPGSGSSRRSGTHPGRGTSGASPGSSGGNESWTMASSGSNSGGPSEEETRVLPDGSDGYESGPSTLGTEDELTLDMLLNKSEGTSSLDVIIDYILEQSPAEYALVHTDDWMGLMQTHGPATDFATRIRAHDNPPEIFIFNQVGMLEATSRHYVDGPSPKNTSTKVRPDVNSHSATRAPHESPAPVDLDDILPDPLASRQPPSAVPPLSFSPLPDLVPYDYSMYTLPQFDLSNPLVYPSQPWYRPRTSRYLPTQHRYLSTPSPPLRTHHSYSSSNDGLSSDGDQDGNDSGISPQSIGGGMSSQNMAESLVNSRKEATRRQRIEAEQKRRDELRDGYARLKDVLPPSNQKSSKISILERATNYISSLDRSSESVHARLSALEADVRRLRDTNEQLRDTNRQLSLTVAGHISIERPLSPTSNVHTLSPQHPHDL